MMRIAVCEKVKKFRDGIKDICNEFFSYSNVKVREYENVTEFKKSIKDGKVFDIIFLDINNGIEVKEYLENRYIESIIIFTTKDDVLDNRAFGRNVWGCIKANYSKNDICKILEKVDKGKKFNNYVIIDRIDGCKQKIKIIDIQYICSEGIYTILYMDTGENIVVRKSLKEWEKELPKIMFIRIHRSYIINLKYVKKISEYIWLKNGQKLKISHGRVKEVKRLYNKYIIEI